MQITRTLHNTEKKITIQMEEIECQNNWHAEQDLFYMNDIY